MGTANWKMAEKQDIKDFIKLEINPVVLALLLQRGINTEEKIKKFIWPNYETGLHDPFLFSEMERVVERIGKVRVEKSKIGIFGDYDADGVTSTVILKETLDALEIESCIYIPDKRSEGYGLNSKALVEFREKGVELILTVDCGITGVDEVEEARSMGIDVIIIDHHHVPQKLPQAYAIINPKMKNSGYPNDNLAGVGVVFKVVEALYKKIFPDKKELIKWLLDLVAIGTVADCVPLLDENRILTKYGLIVLSKTKRVGIKEMYAVARILIDESNQPSTYNISFQLAPRINAAGRMEHANLAYNLLTEKNIVRARELALEIEANNQKRQKVTEKIVEEVKVLAENSFKDKNFIFAVSPHFPIGIVGLAAGKIAEYYHKPTAVLEKREMTSEGSFRSIPEINIIETIEKCSELLIKFGGHSQAAGIKIKNENLEKFYEKLSGVIERELAGKDISPELKIDAEIRLDEIDFNLVDDLKKMEPFGEGNRSPIFLSRNLIINEIKIVGNGEKHLKLFLRSGSNTPKIYEAIGFNFAKEFKNIKAGDKIDAVYRLEEDTWNGNKKIQLKLVDLRISL